MKKVNQSGFGLLSTILLLVMVAMIGGTGFYVYSAQKDTSKSLDNAANATDTVARKTETSKPEPAGSTVLTIPEWGVQMNLPDGVKDANYKLETSQFGQFAHLSTDTIDKENPVCGLDEDPNPPRYNEVQAFQSLQRNVGSDSFDNINPDGQGRTVAEGATENPDHIMKIGDYYYSYSHGNGFPCNEKAGEYVTLFRTAFSTLRMVSE